MTVFQGLSQGQDYTILGTKRKKKKKKKKAAVGRQDIEVSSSKGFHMLIHTTWFWYISTPCKTQNQQSFSSN